MTCILDKGLVEMIGTTPLDISICTYNQFRVLKRYWVTFTHDDSHKIPPKDICWVCLHFTLSSFSFGLKRFFCFSRYRSRNPHVLQVLQLFSKGNLSYKWLGVGWGENLHFIIIHVGGGSFFFCCLTTPATSSPNNRAEYFLPYSHGFWYYTSYYY